MKVAILNDYQNAALRMADWSERTPLSRAVIERLPRRPPLARGRFPLSVDDPQLL
jgi:hypothetical protein